MNHSVGVCILQQLAVWYELVQGFGTSVECYMWQLALIMSTDLQRRLSHSCMIVCIYEDIL
jgi:hypothetical protein